MPVGLTKGQVEHSPSIDEDKPFSRQMERELHVYFGWRPYWSSATVMAVQTMKEATQEAEQEQTDPHLRSTREVSAITSGPGMAR